jgi:hypothetical protein
MGLRVGGQAEQCPLSSKGLAGVQQETLVYRTQKVCSGDRDMGILAPKEVARRKGSQAHSGSTDPRAQPEQRAWLLQG